MEALILADLQQAHEQLLACIDELAELTRADRPDTATLAKVRWRLTRASGKRRRLVEQAYARLLETGGPEAIQRVRELRDDNAEMLVASSRHIGSWTIEQVAANWDGYRAASAVMRRAMRARIAAEQTALYPLLAGWK